MAVPQNLSDQNAGQLTQFNAGGSHQDNQNGGVPQGLGVNGQQNMVEQGETKLNAKNYIYSDTLKVDKNTVKDFYFPTKYIGKTFAEVSKLMERPDSKRKYDSIEEASKKRDLEALMSAQEVLKQKSLEKDMNNMMIKHPEFMSSMMAQQPQGQPMHQMPDGSMMADSQMNPQGGEQLPPQSPMAKMGGFQNHYDLGGDLKDAGHNYLMGTGDVALSALGMSNVIKDTDYVGKSADFAKGFANVAGGIAKTALPIAANIILPGSGAVVSGAQQVGSKFNPQDTSEQDAINNRNPAVIQQNIDSNGRPIQTFAHGGGLGNPPIGDPSLYGMSIEDYMNAINTPSTPPTVPSAIPPVYNSLYPRNNSVDYGNENGITPLGTKPSVARAPEAPSSGGTIYDLEGQSTVSNNDRSVYDSQNQTRSSNPPNSVELGSFQNYDPLTENIMKSTSENYEPANSGSQDPSHSGTLPNPDDIGPNETKQTALNAAGTYLPAAYNIGMGLFGKVGKLNADDYINNTKLTNWRNNINPQLKATDEAFASGQAGLRGSGAGGGAYLASMQALANQQAMQKAGIHANAENEYNSRQLQIDQMNAAKGDQAAQMRLQIAQYNAQAKAAKTKTLQEGLGQIGQIAQSDTQNKLATQANQLYAPTFKDQGVYTPYAPEWMKKK